MKEVLGWTINTEAGTVAPPKRKFQELTQLLDILSMQRCIGQKELERLVGKLHSMYLVVPGVVVHLYHIQCALVQRGGSGSCRLYTKKLETGGI